MSKDKASEGTLPESPTIQHYLEEAKLSEHERTIFFTGRSMQHESTVASLTTEIATLRAQRDDLLTALKQDEQMMEMLWKAVPWGKTFNLNLALLNEAELGRKAAIARAESTPEA